jgi:translation initiation factor 3 subunit L
MQLADDLPNFRPHRSEFEVDEDFTDLHEEHEEEYQLNDQIVSFIKYFYNHVRQCNVYDIQEIYETTWHKLTERYFKNEPWPPAEVVAPLVDDDEVFLYLYKELYFRHMYAKLKPTLEDRKDSWVNYCTLWNLVLDPQIQLEERLSLPNSWLWDMMDEFIYQYQAFMHYRCKLKVKTDEELAMLKECEEVWDTTAVLRYLHSLISYSEIVDHLNKLDAAGKSAQHEELDMLKMLGYYAVIGLLRMHNLLGDYRLALKQLDPIDISRRGLLGRSMACHITTYYYMGFAYMMSRRYMDAIKALSNILLYINRTKQYHTRSAAYDIIVKKNEQMFALLAILVSLCPYCLEENLQVLLREKYEERVQRMARGERTCFEELFQFACPKFVDPSPPNYEATGLENLNQEATKLQCALFMNMVEQSVSHNTIRSYLKLYTTIPMSKLAHFLGWDDEQLHKNIWSLKHKSTEQVWNGGSATDGVWASSSDVDFYIDGDMVHVAETKVVHKFGDFFIRHINKFDEIITDLHRSRTMSGTADH